MSFSGHVFLGNRIKRGTLKKNGLVMTKYFQCRLQQQKSPTEIIHEQAWIPDHGAHLGYRVELKGQQGLWEVTSVDRGTYMEQADLADKQRMDRNQRAGSDI
jgi:hypothetical protein